MYEVTISHGGKRHLVSFNESAAPTSDELSKKIEDLTGVPSSRQKLIHKGKQLQIGGVELSELGVKSGGKIMLLGRQYNPQNDVIIQKINKVRSDTEQIKEKVSDLHVQLQGIKNGYIPEDLEAEALSKVHKQCVGCVEQAMKLLELLDTLQTSDERIRSEKKGTVTAIQALLDDCDKLMEKL